MHLKKPSTATKQDYYVGIVLHISPTPLSCINRVLFVIFRHWHSFYRSCLLFQRTAQREDNYLLFSCSGRMRSGSKLPDEIDKYIYIHLIAWNFLSVFEVVCTEDRFFKYM